MRGREVAFELRQVPGSKKGRASELREQPVLRARGEGGAPPWRLQEEGHHTGRTGRGSGGLIQAPWEAPEGLCRG